MTDETRLQPLDGITVLDFTTLPPGAACTVLLADLGAEVIRIEPPAQRGKPSLIFGQVALGRGKRSVTLDLRAPEAAGVLARLAAKADIVIENGAPGAMARRGFGYAEARAANPAIIWCAVTGFGQDGPNAGHAGHDLSYLAHSGLLAALSDDRAWLPGQGLALPAAGMTAAMAIQTALFHRERTGDGAFLDISLSEAAGWFLTCGIGALTESPLVLPPSPDRRLYACADARFVAVACAEPRTWAALCDGLDLPNLKDRLREPDPDGTKAAAIADRFASRPAAEWVDRLAAAGAAVTIVNRGWQVAKDEHVRARGSVATVAETAVPANPVRLRSAADWRTGTSAAPPAIVGGDTDDVLSHAGFSTAEIAALRASELI